MAKSYVAFSPCQITGFFSIHDKSRDPSKIGSTGVGICIERGVTTRVALLKSGRSVVSLNGRRLAKPIVSQEVLQGFHEIVGDFSARIDHATELPVGCGYGTSGAGALGLSLALNDSLGAPLTRLQAAQVAHVAEVKAKTGLGTVISEYSGGLVARLSPGAPGVGKVARFKLPPDVRIVSGTFGPFRKTRVLNNARLSDRVNDCGRNLVRLFLRTPETERFIQLSTRFTNCLSLASRRLENAMKRISAHSIPVSMMMLGESLFSVVHGDRASDAVSAFTMAGLDPIVSRVSYLGGRSY